VTTGHIYVGMSTAVHMTRIFASEQCPFVVYSTYQLANLLELSVRTLLSDSPEKSQLIDGLEEQALSVSYKILEIAFPNV